MPSATQCFGAGRTALLLCIPASLLLAPPSAARTWQIQHDGSGDAASIQGAIYYGSAGDTVLVWPGRYYENIDYLGKDVVLLAKYGPLVTTIDGTGIFDAVVTLGNGESRAAVLEGFTITAGQGSRRFGSDIRGGGVMCYRSSPTIRGNRIVGNRAGVGGGLAVGDGQVVSPRPFPLIEGNLFADNISTGNAGALSIEHVDIIVRKNVFQNNSCGYDGGAIRAYFVDGSGVFEQNQFIENEAGDHAGGLIVAGYVGMPRMTIQFNLFARNVAHGSGFGDTGSGGGAFLEMISGVFARNTLVANTGLGESPSSGGGLLLELTSSALEVKNNIFAFNEGSGIACNLEVNTEPGMNLFWQNTIGEIGGPGSTCPLEWSASQIVSDPLFCNLATDDFRVASNSPAIMGEEVMGAYAEPGCGPVAVERTTWGRIKAMYGSPGSKSEP